MNFRLLLIYTLLSLFGLSGCVDNEPSELILTRIFIGPTEINIEGAISTNLPIDRSITLIFSSPVKTNTAINSIALLADNQVVDATLNFSDNSVTIFPSGALGSGIIYTVRISEGLKGTEGQPFAGLDVMFKTALQDIQVTSISIGNRLIEGNNRIMDIPLDLSIVVNFSNPVELLSFQNAIKLTGTNAPPLTTVLSNNNQTGTITAAVPLKDYRKYTLTFQSTLKGVQGEGFSEYSKIFFTGASNIPKFPLISEEELLTKVQQQTFKYFWDFAQPASGMARERNTSGDLITSGGSGFGLMSIIVGIERGFISRAQGIERFDKILDFIETADRFHGAWPHWMNGNTGKVIPFSTNDNGGDIVETSFLMQGLITVRQYLNAGNATESQLIDRINTLYQGVEWDWYRRGEQNVMYWHWSPDKGWAMNLQVRGWNEALMVYLLAASSPTHTIPKIVYDNGWANNGAMRNGNVYEGITLPLGYAYGGPLFLSQYSFLCLDPRGLSDAYCADYFNQNKNHSLINYKYCIRNPRNFVGYSSSNWGLTASDNHQGYNAHSPTNDLGVITPTAALSAFPFTPVESMEALKFFYYTLGDRLWGEYGFYDAFNITENWYASSYLAIDQGPIIVMIENHRTGLLWDLFMSAPEVQSGLTKLGFTY
jgi:hypothetical protein